MTPILLTQELETRSLGKSVFLRQERDVWDQLQWQKGLCCADAKVEAATT